MINLYVLRISQIIQCSICCLQQTMESNQVIKVLSKVIFEHGSKIGSLLLELTPPVLSECFKFRLIETALLSSIHIFFQTIKCFKERYLRT